MTGPEVDAVDYIEQTKRTYSSLGYGEYRWAHNEDAPPWAPLTKPLSESRVGLIASGGVYVEGQVAFTHKDDVTHREIPMDVQVADLRVTHFAFDQTNARRDPNCIFPIDPLRALARRVHWRIGASCPYFHGRHLLATTFDGGIDASPRQPHLEMGVDVVLLVPV